MKPHPIQSLEKIYDFITKHNYKIHKLVVVTKTHSEDLIQLLYDHGHRDFGENKYQEAKEKFPKVKINPNDPFTGHHIGPLQTGNARKIPDVFTWVHGVGSFHALSELAKSAKKKFELLNIKTYYLIQLNLTKEHSKLGGMYIEEFELAFHNNPEQFIQHDGLIWQGFMTMGPSDGDPQKTREVFKQLRRIRDRYKPSGDLSMGMSGDWTIALEEGATILRIGSLITGERK